MDRPKALSYGRHFLRMEFRRGCRRPLSIWNCQRYVELVKMAGNFKFENSGSPLLTAFALIGAASFDPIWKVIHLYSMELFPTVVRNMARAVCNMGSRMGSLLAPQVIKIDFLRNILLKTLKN